MFIELFLFEIKYRLSRPAFYCYFFPVLVFAAVTFCKGMVPAGDGVHINAPAVLIQYSSILSFFLMLMSAFFMGVTLYRDIEHGVSEYYLSYPVSRPGYFWGRFLGSFVFVALTGAAILLGAWLGTLLGPLLHIQPADRYGPNRFIYYWQPYCTIILPNLFFTSALFFGLVSVFRTVKVIYSGAMFLFLGYLIGNFFLNNIHNLRVIYLSDPFLLNGLRIALNDWSPQQLNTAVLPFQGLLLQNRMIWMSIGLVIVLLTYWRFSFERFFRGAGAKRISAEHFTDMDKRWQPRSLNVQFGGAYNGSMILNLTRIEVLNIVRDTYFWIILTGGYIFLSFVFFHGPGSYTVPDYPRTVYFMNVFIETFLFFIFLVVAFYTGETVHREKLTRYSFINDTLPPPTWIFNCAKLISLILLGLGLALTPVWIGLITQVVNNYTSYNLPMYASSELVMIIPRVLEYVLLCYAIHIAVDNKYLGHGIAVVIFVLLLGITKFGYADYCLLLYSYSPLVWASDMDGIGHMVKPLLWYNVYWTFAGAVLVVIGSLWYSRGTRSAFREKWKLAAQRFAGTARVGVIALSICFLTTGAYIYYNVSFLNEYLTPGEKKERAAIAEMKMKRYAALPLPSVTRIRMEVAAYPDQKKQETRAFCTIANKGNVPIDSLLLDGGIAEYKILANGEELSYTCPLYFRPGKFNPFRSSKEPSDYRVYQLPRRLNPGDTMTLELHCTLAFKGFQNGLYAAQLLDNGILTTGNLPAPGYDQGDELERADERKAYGLPQKKYIRILQDDPAGRMEPYNGFSADLISTDILMSVPEGQWALAPGVLKNEWSKAGRHFFHYVQDSPLVYMPYIVMSARYAIRTDTVQLQNGRLVPIRLCYYPMHDWNLSHFNMALKDGLHYFSKALGPYPFASLSLVETPSYGPSRISVPGVIGLAEPNMGWVADLRGRTAPDYLYFNAASQLARQWWNHEIAGNNTEGAKVIGQAIANYSALRLMEKRFGKTGARFMYDWIRGDYGWRRRIDFNGETPLLYGNESYIFNQKGTLVLYGLAETLGEDTLNAALSEFLGKWAFRNGGPYPGANDLYAVLKAHTPDSLRYYLTDTWEKITFYDNKVIDATVFPESKGSGYRVRLRVRIRKTQYNDKKEEQDVTDMNDIVDIGVYSKPSGNEAPQLLQLYSARFSAGEHTIDLKLSQKPSFVQIDPGSKLLDMRGDDNRKELK
ncbi:MAG TPA: hypothetical protein VGE90_14760 [Chitinophaga sp.]